MPPLGGSNLDEAYVQTKIDPLLQMLLTEVIAEQPTDPARFMIEKLQSVAQTKPHNELQSDDDSERVRLLKQIDDLQRRLKVFASVDKQVLGLTAFSAHQETEKRLHGRLDSGVDSNEGSSNSSCSDDDNDYADLPDVLLGQVPKGWNPGSRQAVSAPIIRPDLGSPIVSQTNKHPPSSVLPFLTASLKQTSIFGRFEDDELEEVAASFVRKKFPAGSIVRSPHDSAFLIVEHGIVDALQSPVFESFHEKNGFAEHQQGMGPPHRKLWQGTSPKRQVPSFALRTSPAMLEGPHSNGSTTAPFAATPVVAERGLSDEIEPGHGKSSKAVPLETDDSPEKDIVLNEEEGPGLSIFEDKPKTPSKTRAKRSSGRRAASWLRSQLASTSKKGSSKTRNAEAPGFLSVTEGFDPLSGHYGGKSKSGRPWIPSTSFFESYSSARFASQSELSLIVGSPAFVQEFRQGDVIGELDFLCGFSSSITYQARTEVTVWSLDDHVCQQLVVGCAAKKATTIRAFVASVPLFEKLTEEELAKLADVACELVYSKREVILKQGDQPSHLIIVKSGVVSESRCLGEQQHSITLRQLETYCWFGESCLMEESKLQREIPSASNFVAASEGVRVLAIAGKDAVRLVGSIAHVLATRPSKDLWFFV